ncbi:hypothetical protein ACIPL1_27255 [Pseudomonas sp. NPDC090202]|uniref:hypothetical protein n=1 Tax=unclassified Pseudomonas TaxID=196821 RepID=UPI00380E73D2
MANECQFHNNCGGYCETPDQIAANLCEDCYEAEQQADAERARFCLIEQAATDLLDELDSQGRDYEYAPSLRDYMAKLRAALA